MIGKKSQFKEHELQNKDGAESIRQGVSKKTSRNPVSIEVAKRNLAKIRESRKLEDTSDSGIITDEQESRVYDSEEKIQEIPEEIQQIVDPSLLSGKFKTHTSDNKTSGGQPTILTGSVLKSDTDLLWDEICNGVNGKNSGIPMGFNRLNKYLGLRRSIYTTIGAAAGCGKTSLVDCAYVLNPYDWYVKNKHNSKIKFEVIYFSMERKKTYKLAKWLCMKIFKEENVLMTTDELLSWGKKLDPKRQEMADFYIKGYFKEMTESGIIKIIDGQQNPTGIYKFMKDNALTKGKIDEISEYEKRYIPDDDNLITNVVHDHAGKTKNENIGGKYDKKLTIDKASEYYCWARDFLGYSPIMINQFNRTAYQDIQFSRKEGQDPDPTVEYWKDSGNVIEDADVAISLFNPYKYNLEKYMDYNIEDFTDGQGNNKFRGLKIIKNSYGTDNLRIGLGFLGEVSLFKELTKSSEISQKELNKVINNDFFLDF